MILCTYTVKSKSGPPNRVPPGRQSARVPRINHTNILMYMYICVYIYIYIYIHILGQFIFLPYARDHRRETRSLRLIAHSARCVLVHRKCCSLGRCCKMLVGLCLFCRLCSNNVAVAINLTAAITQATSNGPRRARARPLARRAAAVAFAILVEI